MELEFTIEPFVEGRPGRHVQAAVAAVEASGVNVEFGPFGSTCRADDAEMPAIVAAIVATAFANGATHVSLHVTSQDTPERDLTDGARHHPSDHPSDEASDRRGADG